MKQLSNKLNVFNKATIALLVIFFFSTSAWAQVNIWQGTSQGSGVGNQNRDKWNIDANWSLGITPTSAHDVIIPVAGGITVNQPTLTANGVAKSININASATLTIGVHNISVSQTIINAGTITGTGNLSAAKLTLVETGTINTGTHSYTTLEYQTSNVRTTNDAEFPASVQNLIIDATADVTLHANRTLNNVTISNSKLNIGANTLTINGTLTEAGNGAVVTATTGEIVHAATGVGASYTALGLTITSDNAFGNVTIKRGHSQNVESIKRYYNITTDNAPVNGTIIFRYDDSEHSLNSTDEDDLILYKYTGSKWQRQLASTTDANANTITLTGVTSFSSWTAAGSFAAMPVELLFFQAKSVRNEVQLSWATASEINNSHFEIERSRDGRNWSKIGEVKGAGTASNTSNYRFIDTETFNGVTYYRLNQVDYDGNSALSNVSTIKKEGGVITNLYPNPAIQGEAITLLASDASSGKTIIEIMNIAGQVVFTQSNDGISKITIPTNQLTKGTYILSVTTEGNREIHKISVK
jgi:hypothetical protein